MEHNKSLLYHNLEINNKFNNEFFSIGYSLAKHIDITMENRNIRNPYYVYRSNR